MKYVYIGRKYAGEDFRKTIDVNYHLKGWLEAIILSEQPYLAEGLKIENPDEEITVLLKLCRFFNAVLKDEHPDPISTSEWGLEFESKHHGVIGMYLNFIRNIYEEKQE